MSEILGETQAGELPARMGWKEISISRPDVTGGCHAGAAAQHELAGHELAVVFADRAGCRPEAWLRPERAARPLPDLPLHLLPRSAERRVANDAPVRVDLRGPRIINTKTHQTP